MVFNLLINKMSFTFKKKIQNSQTGELYGVHRYLLQELSGIHSRVSLISTSLDLEISKWHKPYLSRKQIIKAKLQIKGLQVIRGWYNLGDKEEL